MKFKLGQVVTTRTIRADIDEDVQFRKEVFESFARYTNCDWGDTHEDDKPLNDEALKYGERILAAYKTSKGKIWIITEWDRSATTILYPDEY